MLTAEARTRKALRCQGLEPVPLAAGAGEDWAALSGRPRKANASQYETVMPQRLRMKCVPPIQLSMCKRSARGDFAGALGALLLYLVVRNPKVLKRLRDNIAHHRRRDRSAEVPLLLVRIVNHTQNH